jgi:hypothetical protein
MIPKEHNQEVRLDKWETWFPVAEHGCRSCRDLPNQARRMMAGVKRARTSVSNLAKGERARILALPVCQREKISILIGGDVNDGAESDEDHASSAGLFFDTSGR